MERKLDPDNGTILKKKAIFKVRVGMDLVLMEHWNAGILSKMMGRGKTRPIFVSNNLDMVYITQKRN